MSDCIILFIFFYQTAIRTTTSNDESGKMGKRENGSFGWQHTYGKYIYIQCHKCIWFEFMFRHSTDHVLCSYSYAFTFQMNTRWKRLCLHMKSKLNTSNGIVPFFLKNDMVVDRVFSFLFGCFSFRHLNDPTDLVGKIVAVFGIRFLSLFFLWF